MVVYVQKGLQDQTEMNNLLQETQGINNQFYQKNVYEREYYNFSIPWSVNYQYSLNLSRFKQNKKIPPHYTNTGLGCRF